MEEHDDLTRRLHALGEQPVDPAVASRHLTTMGMASAPRGSWWSRARVGAAFAAGLLLGGTGLAAAAPNTLPGPAQDAFSKVGGAVGINIQTSAERSTAGCDGTYKNHGQYVAAQAHKLHDDSDGQSLTPTVTGGNSAAAHSDCGKPVQSVHSTSNTGGATTQSDTTCGKPPWAGKGNSLSPQAKAAAQAQRKQQCGADADEQGTEQEAPATTTPTTGKPAVTGQSGEDHGKPASPGKSATAGTQGESTTTPTTEDHGKPGSPGKSATAGEGHAPTTTTSTAAGS